jgi:hypothetical protein
VALLLVGFARPKASFHVKAQEATLVLVLDRSGSMAANDARPTRFAAAKSIVQRFLAKAPSGYRIGLVTFSDHVAVSASPTHTIAAVTAALARAHTGPQGTALADAIARAVRVASAVHGSVAGHRPPAGDRRALGRRSDHGPRDAATGRAARRARSRVDDPDRTPDGVVQQKLKGGFTERIQVPAVPQALEVLARGRREIPAAAAVDVAGLYGSSGRAPANARRRSR